MWTRSRSWISVVAVLLVSGLLKWQAADSSVSAERIRTAVVTRGDLVRDINVQGRIVAAVSPTLYSPDNGTVTLQVQPGELEGGVGFAASGPDRLA